MYRKLSYKHTPNSKCPKCIVSEEKLNLTIQNYENRISDLVAKHTIEIYEKENEFQKLLQQRELDSKAKLKKLQSKYENRLQDLVIKVRFCILINR